MAPDTPPDDRALALRLQHGEPAAFEQVFHAYYVPLVRYAYRTVRAQEMAEELVQDVFGRMWLHRERLTTPSSVRSYLYAAVRNAVISYARHAATHDAFATVSAADLDVPHDDALRAVERQETVDRVRDALRRLPPHYQEVLRLKWHDGLAHCEIAGVLGLSEKAVERQVARAAAKLRELL